MHLEVGAVQEQVIELDVGQIPGAEGLELVAQASTDPAGGRLGQGRFGAERLGQQGFDVAVGQAPHPRRDHQRLERLGAHDALAQQARGEPLGRVAQLRALELDRPGGGLDRQLAVAVALPGPVTAGPGVPAPAEPARHLVLEDLLENEPGRQAHHLLEHLGDVTA